MPLFIIFGEKGFDVCIISGRERKNLNTSAMIGMRGGLFLFVVLFDGKWVIDGNRCEMTQCDCGTKKTVCVCGVISEDKGQLLHFFRKWTRAL